MSPWLFWVDDLTIVVPLFNQNYVAHPWVCENGVAPDRALDPAVLSRLKQFSAMNKLKKMALRVCNKHNQAFMIFTSNVFANYDFRHQCLSWYMSLEYDIITELGTKIKLHSLPSNR